MHSSSNATSACQLPGLPAIRPPGTDAKARDIDSNRLVAMLSDVSCELVRSTSFPKYWIASSR